MSPYFDNSNQTILACSPLKISSQSDDSSPSEYHKYLYNITIYNISRHSDPIKDEYISLSIPTSSQLIHNYSYQIHTDWDFNIAPKNVTSRSTNSAVTNISPYTIQTSAPIEVFYKVTPVHYENAQAKPGSIFKTNSISTTGYKLIYNNTMYKNNLLK